MSGSEELIEVGSDNIFVDLGFEPGEAEELMARSKCIQRIARIKEQRAWSQAELGKVIGMSQSEVSLLLRGKVSRFSLERLLHALKALGIAVRITLLDDDNPHLVVEDRVGSTS